MNIPGEIHLQPIHSHAFLRPLQEDQQMFTMGLENAQTRFNPLIGLIKHSGREGHSTILSLSYAHALLHAQGKDAMPVVEDIVRKVLSTQERQENHRHYGNFRLIYEEQAIPDLNAVQFILEYFLPLYIDYGEWFDSTLREEISLALRLAVREIIKLKVPVAYTNITILSLLGLQLAGEILQDNKITDIARNLMDEWIAWTNRSGTVAEFNSPTYIGIGLAALSELAQRTQSEAMAIKALMMEERLWLHTATHYHHSTLQMSGPYSRAYQPDAMGWGSTQKSVLYRALGDERLLSDRLHPSRPQGNTRMARHPFHIPDYMQYALIDKPYPYLVQETADSAEGVDMTTYMTPSYALSTLSASAGEYATRTCSWQRVPFTLHYRKEATPGYGLLFARYLCDDQELGHRDRFPSESGWSWCVQHENKGIVLYSSMLPRDSEVTSLKTEVLLLQGRKAEIWHNEERVQSFPREVLPHDTLVLADEDTYVALRPLRPTSLGKNALIMLEQRGNDLVLVIYNYKGPQTRFWDLSKTSDYFYKGNVKNGFIVEVSERSHFEDVSHFRAHIVHSWVSDTHEDQNENIRTVSYVSGTDRIEITVDLYYHKLIQRRINGAIYQAPMLASPIAVQTSECVRTIGAARLETGEEHVAAWLQADDAHNCWVAVNPDQRATMWHFETPAGRVRTVAWGFGKMVWRGDERVELELLSTCQHAALAIYTQGKLLQSVTWNGHEVSSECIYDDQLQCYVLPVGARAVTE